MAGLATQSSRPAFFIMEIRYRYPVQYIDKADCHERLRFWQQILRLNDWNISLSFGTAKELKAENPEWKRMGFKSAAAMVGYQVQYKNAIVFFVSDAPQVSMFGAVRDDEVALVHELMHLHLAIHDVAFAERVGNFTKPGKDHALERICEMSARSIVAAYRYGLGVFAPMPEMSENRA